jgi:hypothetical protein
MAVAESTGTQSSVVVFEAGALESVFASSIFASVLFSLLQANKVTVQKAMIILFHNVEFLVVEFTKRHK